MKLIMGLVLVAAAYFAWQHFQGSASESANLVAELKNGEGVTVAEAKTKAHEVASFFCNDGSYQQELGSTTESCLQRYHVSSAQCEAEVFGSVSSDIRSEEQLKSLLKQFNACVSRPV